jgi:uncharacterized membrane protein YphA (DoxX/SURF4 family)
MQNLTATSTNVANGSTRMTATQSLRLMRPTATRRPTSRTNVSLWVVQGMLAATFVFAGSMKLVLPVESLTEGSPFAGWFLRFIGIVELLGGVGVILPSLLRIKTFLTPLAAAGLVIVMAGAVASTVVDMGVASAAFPFVVGALALFVAYGRTRLAPQSNH